MPETDSDSDWFLHLPAAVSDRLREIGFEDRSRRRDPAKPVAADVARLTECLARLIDVAAGFALALAALPEPGHVFYHQRVTVAVSQFMELLDEARANLLRADGEGRS